MNNQYTHLQDTGSQYRVADTAPYLLSTHNQILDKIHTRNYFVYLLPIDPPKDFSPEELNNYWHEFWYSLPDSREIHSQCFYEVCDFMDELNDLISQKD